MPKPRDAGGAIFARSALSALGERRRADQARVGATRPCRRPPEIDHQLARGDIAESLPIGGHKRQNAKRGELLRGHLHVLRWPL